MDTTQNIGNLYNMETKVIPKPLHKEPIEPSPRVLGSLIKLVEQEVEQEGGTIDSYQELADRLNGRFNIKEITPDDLVRFYTPYLYEQEAKYYKYWYDRVEEY